MPFEPGLPEFVVRVRLPPKLVFIELLLGVELLLCDEHFAPLQAHLAKEESVRLPQVRLERLERLEVLPPLHPLRDVGVQVDI